MQSENILKFKLELEDFLDGIPSSCRDCVLAKALKRQGSELPEGLEGEIMVSSAYNFYDEEGVIVLDNSQELILEPYKSALKLITEFDRLKYYAPPSFEEKTTKLYEQFKDEEFIITRYPTTFGVATPGAEQEGGK